jgi:hypothetical protein
MAGSNGRSRCEGLLVRKGKHEGVIGRTNAQKVLGSPVVLAKDTVGGLLPRW